MSQLMNHPRPSTQDWGRWAQTAEPRDCVNCLRAFKPNHPRRRQCGLLDCREVAARMRAQPDPDPARARTALMQGLLGDVLVQVHRAQGDATDTALKDAVRGMLALERRGRPARSAYVRVMAICAARVLQTTA